MNSLKFETVLPNPEDFFELFITTGWNNKYKLSEEDLTIVLENSWFCLSAYDRNELIGFGRIICDGKVHALILDLIVRPEYHKRGIGDKILEILIDKCLQHQIRDIQLFCAKGYSRFYEKRGFIKRPENAPGMEYTGKPNQ